MIPDILAERYASKEIKQIWSAEGKILLERDMKENRRVANESWSKGLPQPTAVILLL